MLLVRGGDGFIRNGSFVFWFFYFVYRCSRRVLGWGFRCCFIGVVGFYIGVFGEDIFLCIWFG